MKCRKIIIATGSSSLKSGIFTKSKKVMTSEEFLYSDELPKDVVIIGGGPEGMEFASMLSNFGSNVTIIEMQNRLLPLEDADISAIMHKQLDDSGVKIILNAKVTDIFDQGSRVGIKLSDKTIDADMILVSTGRSPNSESFSLLNLRHDKKNSLLVNEKMETSMRGVYAIGDVAGGRYAHEAMQNGIVAAENAMGLNSSMKNQVIPRCIYTIPEIACVGMNEGDARKIPNILVGKVNLKSSGRAMTMGDTNGIVKVIIDKRKKKILGLHIVNERASDMIGEGVLAMKHLTTDELINSIHPHPTLSESIREAVMDAYGISIHSISRNKKNRPKSLRQYS